MPESENWIKTQPSLTQVYWFEYWLSSYAVDGVDEWIVATVTHRQPMTCKENDIDVAVPRINKEKEYQDGSRNLNSRMLLGEHPYEWPHGISTDNSDQGGSIRSLYNKICDVIHGPPLRYISRKRSARSSIAPRWNW